MTDDVQPQPGQEAHPDVSAADRLASVMEAMQPQLEAYLKVRGKEARDVLFWLWVKRLGMVAIVVVMAMIYALSSAAFLGVQPTLSSPGVVIVDVSGGIGPGSLASGDRIVPIIEKACASDNTQALILRINSPGGAPADAERIGAAAERCKNWPNYREGAKRKVYAVIDGLGASAGYLIAIHADHIVANKTALVGSIGAVLSRLEFGEAMDRFGVRSMEYATGPLKTTFSPYRADTKEQQRYAQHLVDSALEVFRGEVIKRRPMIDPNNAALFTGAVWSGVEARDLGLVDEVGILEDVLERDFHDLPRQLIRPRRTLEETMQMDTWVGALAERLTLATNPRLQ